MTNLIDFYSGSEDGPNTVLSEARLGVEPTMLCLFTPDYEQARLHFIDDDSVRSFVLCPGTACPVCHCAVEPQLFNLLAVFDVASGAVKVLRVSARRQQGCLGALLVLHLRDKAVASKVILISRNGAKYTVEARPLAPNAKRGEGVIKAFLEEQQTGLKLESAFPRMTPEELSEVPTIAAKLAAIGGWEPPADVNTDQAPDQEPEAGSEEP